MFFMSKNSWSPFSQPFDVHVAYVAPSLSPLLLVPTLVTLAAAVCAVLRLVEPIRRATWVLTVGSAAALGVVGTLPLYDVPLAAVFELAKGTPDEFRHPVFGNKSEWRDQFRVKFLSKARAQLRPETTKGWLISMRSTGRAK